MASTITGRFWPACATEATADDSLEGRLPARGKSPVLSARVTLAIRSDHSAAKDVPARTPHGGNAAFHTREAGFNNGDGVRTGEKPRLPAALRTRTVFSDELPVVTAASNCSSDFAGRKLQGCGASIEMLPGYRVAREQKPAAQRRITSWRSPDLDRVEWRRLAEFLDSAGRVTDASGLTAERIVAGEPDTCSPRRR